MKKIISIIIIFILMLSCNIANARILTKEEVANFMLNGYGTQNDDVTDTMINNVNNRMGTWQTIADLTSQYEGKYSIGYNYRTKIFFFVYYTGSTNALNNQYTTSVMFSNNNAYIGRYAAMANNLNLTYNYYNYDLVNDNLTNSTVNNGSVNNTCFGYSNTSIYWIYTDRYISYSTSFSISAHGQKPTGTDLFAENYISSIQWNITPISQATLQIPNNENTFYQITKEAFYTNFGTLKNAEYLGTMDVEIYAYNGTEWIRTNLLKLYDYTIQNLSVFGPLISNENNIKTLILRLNSKSLANNTFIYYNIHPTSQYSQEYNIDNLRGFFYIVDENTIINNGILDIQATFSGDNNLTNYENNVNAANENLQKDYTNNLNDINNTLEEAKEQNKNFFNWITDTFNNLWTFDSGDIQRLTNNLEEGLQDIGFNPEEQINLFYDILTSEPTDFVIEYPNINIHLTTNNGQDLINTNLISGDKINFSRMARQNPTLYSIKTYLNIILSISMLGLIYTEFIATTQEILGLNPSNIKEMVNDDVEAIHVARIYL